MTLFKELKRRNVFRVAVAYLIVSWVLVQVSATLAPAMHLPEWVNSGVVFVLILGLPLVIVFAWAFEITPEGIKKEKEVDRSQSITSQTGRKLDYIIIGVLCLGIVFLLVDRFTGSPEAVATAEREKSIAVLPFINMSSDPEQEFFSDGITEEILNALAAVKELKVAGRTSSFAFKGDNQDLRKIGDTLGVANILEGSVRKSGTTVRITAQLVQVDDGFHLWSETYDRELTDVFAIQDDIAAEILKQLKARLLDGEAAVVESARTDPRVYDLYLLARQRMYARTGPMIESAAKLLDQAIALDPDYAPAQAQRGIATLLLTEITYGTTPVPQALEQSRPFLDRALALDPQSAEGWAGLGLYYLNVPAEYEQGITALTKALSINPSMIDASNWLYITLTATGDSRGALQLVEVMTDRDPLYRPGFGNAVQTFDSFGMKDKAQSLIDRFRTFNPDDAQLLQAQASHNFFYGKTVEGMRLAERAIALAPKDAVTRFMYSVGLAQTQQVEKLVTEGGLGWPADALDYLGRRDEAFVKAREGAEAGYPEALFILFNRAGKSQEVVNYLEERWPDIAAFAAANPHDTFGYTLMVEVAIAYARVGKPERANEALSHVEQAVARLAEAGVDNFIYDLGVAEYLAAAGDYDAAVAKLAAVIERGYQGYPDLATSMPAFEPLREDPRLVAAEATMVANINEDRQQLGLGPIDPAAAWR